MRYLYSFLFYLALPFVFLRLLWRSRRSAAYRRRWPERLGFYPFTLQQCIWVHAVSVGETIAAKPLIEGLLARYPSIPIVVTTMTVTGAAQVEKLFGQRVRHAYIPYDLPDATARFLRRIRPIVGVIMETELWPNLLNACQQQQVPVYLLNARLSEQSARGYQRIRFAHHMFDQIKCIAAHGQADAERFIALGADPKRVVVTGSIKFDLQLPADLMLASERLREQLGKDRFIWVAASTHAGEEEKVLAVHQALREKYPHSLLVLVPRHPERFDAVAKMCEQSFVTARRSQSNACTPDTAVYLADTMGELMLMYGASEVAFIGGSFVPTGGHNMLEPAALAKPVLTGPHLFNFAEISQLLQSSNAMTVVQDEAALIQQLLLLANDTAIRTQMGLRAKAVVDANRGALAKQLSIIEHSIDPSTGA